MGAHSLARPRYYFESCKEGKEKRETAKPCFSGLKKGQNFTVTQEPRAYRRNIFLNYHLIKRLCFVSSSCASPLSGKPFNLHILSNVAIGLNTELRNFCFSSHSTIQRWLLKSSLESFRNHFSKMRDVFTRVSEVWYHIVGLVSLLIGISPSQRTG
jgi:hypothetical protein